MMKNKLNFKSLILSVVAATAIFSAPASQAGLEPFIGEVMWVGFNFCPRGYAEADGQLLAISSNTALFSLLGTTYGGDGRTNFALPDLRGRSSVHVGLGPGLSQISDGEMGGRDFVSLAVNQLPSHTHAATLQGTSTSGNVDSPEGALHASKSRSGVYNNTAVVNANMSPSSISIANTGSNQPIAIRSPFLAMRACVALTGIFPSRN